VWRSRRSFLLAGLTALFALGAAAATYSRRDTPGWWGAASNWQGSTLPKATDTGIAMGVYSSANAGHPYNAYLQSGDAFSYPNADLYVGGTFGGSMAGTVVTLTIPVDASLEVKNAYVPGRNSRAGVTGVVEVVGGTLQTTGGALYVGSQADAFGVARFKDTAFTRLTTMGWLGPGAVYADHSVLGMSGSNCIIGNSASARLELHNGSKLTAPGMIVGSNSTLGAGDVVLVDSAVDTTGNVTVGTSANGCSFIQTNSTVRCTVSSVMRFDRTSRGEMIGCSTNVGFSSVTVSGSAKVLIDGESAYLQTATLVLLPNGASQTQDVTIARGRVRLTGTKKENGIQFHPGSDTSGHTTGLGMTTVRQTGGTVTSVDLTFGTRGAHHPRYEISGNATLRLEGNPTDGYAKGATILLGNATSTSGTFSMRGSAVDVAVSYFEGLNQIEYVIDRTGAPCMKRPFDSAWGASYVDWIGGAHSVRLAGGVQLLHTNLYVLVDSHTDVSPAGRNIKAWNSADYADLNGAPRHLWTFGPHADASSNPIGVLAGTRTFGAKLNDAEELQVGAFYAQGRPLGWVRLPRFRTKQNVLRVLLDVEPQGNHTLAEIADGLTAAGNRTVVRTSGTYNLQVSLPAEDILVGASGECVAFDFADYNNAEAIRDNTPDVRALVHRIGIVRDPGFVMVIRR